MIKCLMITMGQVHENRVVHVGKIDDGKIIKNCDGLITNDSDVELSVRVADCLPIFITDLRNGSIGLVHAGWRGLAKEIIKNTLRLMAQDFASKPENMAVFIGPHICRRHYEVKRDVSEYFTDYKKAILSKGGKTYLDLALVAKMQLINLGIKPKNIKTDESCTFENKDLFSFRRNKTEKRNRYLFELNI